MSNSSGTMTKSMMSMIKLEQAMKLSCSTSTASLSRCPQIGKITKADVEAVAPTLTPVTNTTSIIKIKATPTISNNLILNASFTSRRNREVPPQHRAFLTRSVAVATTMQRRVIFVVVNRNIIIIRVTIRNADECLKGSIRNKTRHHNHMCTAVIKVVQNVTIIQGQKITTRAESTRPLLKSTVPSNSSKLRISIIKCTSSTIIIFISTRHRLLSLRIDKVPKTKTTKAIVILKMRVKL